MKNRTASDWLEWAKKLAHYSNMTWHGQVTGVDYSIAAKILAEKCEELHKALKDALVSRECEACRNSPHFVNKSCDPRDCPIAKIANS